MRNHSVTGVLLAAFLSLCTPVAAQDYPNRPVTIIVPFAAGGPADVLARQLATGLSDKLGQPFVIENVSGGGTTVGTARVARSAPDGYTLLLTNMAIASNVTLYPKLPFDPEKDLTTIGFVNHSALVLVGRKTLPANSLAELAAWMRSNRATIAHTGAGSTAHLSAVLLAQAVGAEVDYLPYRGGAPALQDTIAGHIDMTFVAAQVAPEPVNAGLVKGFGIMAKTRYPSLPQVAALGSELNPKLDIPFWHALFARADTPKPVVDKLNAALQGLLEDPKIIQAWAALGAQVYPKDQRSPEAGDAILRSEIKRWGEVIRENKIEGPQQ